LASSTAAVDSAFAVSATAIDDSKKELQRKGPALMFERS